MWEYKVIKTTATGVPLGEGKTHAEQLEAGFNKLGAQGWELCAILGTLIFLKRLKRT